METVFSSAPQSEPQRQFYFMDFVREKVTETADQLGRPLTFFVKTFGCQMNARDSEKLTGILETVGYRPAETENADFVIYNTCTVRQNADNHVYGKLGYLTGYKKKNPHMRIALCGCMMQEEHVRDKILKSYPAVDLIFGTHNLYRFAELLYRMMTEDSTVCDIDEEASGIVEDLPVDRKYPFKSGVNIMFGCDNFCSYCIVPYVRGRERSRKPQDILREIESLADDGVKEVMLLGQNVNSYGKNMTPQVTFAELLAACAKIDGIKRIRFMTSHPKDLSDELISVIASNNKICRHLHLPLQSGSSRLLRRMNRRYDKETYLSLVDRIRSAVPDIALTTDIIVGYPGETEEDFEETLDVCRRVRFDSAFTFLYSPRTGTPAAKDKNQIPSDIAQERFDRLLTLVRQCSAERANARTGQVEEVLVESVNEKNPDLLTGRLSCNSVVHFPGNPSEIGTFVTVRLSECRDFYYMGSRV